MYSYPLLTYFPDMQSKLEGFQTFNGIDPYSAYDSWEISLDGPMALHWPRLQLQLAEDFQFGLLRALAVSGTIPGYWDHLFMSIGYGLHPFEDLGKSYFQGTLRNPHQYFLRKLTEECTEGGCLPPVCPEFLFPYRYTQRAYLSDLAQVWENIHEDYYIPWATTRIGQDSPEIARLKKIGREACKEIDLLAGYTIPHFWNQRSVNEPPF